MLVPALLVAFSLLLGGVVGWFLGAAQVRAQRDRDLKKLTDTFGALASRALAANNEGFLALASEKMLAARRESDAEAQAREKAINAIVKPVKESLDKVDGKIAELEVARAHAYTRLHEQVRTLSTTQERLTAETGNLARALRAPSVRGRWGELQLKRTVEIAGMVEHCDFGQQVTLATGDGVLRPDMVVRLAGGRHVVVDAKVPLEAYLASVEATEEPVRRERIKEHAAQVRAHVHKLSSKAYWSQVANTPEFVVMFLPGEAMFGAALEEMPSLIEESAARHVLLATPTTLIALLQTVHFGWREEKLAKNAQEISEQGRILHERIAIVLDHWGKLGGALGKATEHFNAAVASFESRLVSTAHRLDELGAAGKKPVSALPHLEILPRLMARAAGDEP